MTNLERLKMEIRGVDLPRVRLGSLSTESGIVDIYEYNPISTLAIKRFINQRWRFFKSFGSGLMFVPLFLFLVEITGFTCYYWYTKTTQ